jgi:hypothetical protein
MVCLQYPFNQFSLVGLLSGSFCQKTADEPPPPVISYERESMPGSNQFISLESITTVFATLCFPAGSAASGHVVIKSDQLRTNSAAFTSFGH